MRNASILKNLHTLHIRMKKHGENAMYLAKRFKEVGFKYNYRACPSIPTTPSSTACAMKATATAA